MTKAADNNELFSLMESVIGYHHTSPSPIPVSWIIEKLEVYLNETRGARLEVYGHYVVHNFKRLDISLEYVDNTPCAFISEAATQRLFTISNVMTDEKLVPFISENIYIKEMINKETILLIEGAGRYDPPSEILSDGSCCRKFTAANRDFVLRWERQKASFISEAGIPFLSNDNAELLVVREIIAQEKNGQSIKPTSKFKLLPYLLSIITQGRYYLPDALLRSKK